MKNAWELIHIFPPAVLLLIELHCSDVTIDAYSLSCSSVIPYKAIQCMLCKKIVHDSEVQVDALHGGQAEPRGRWQGRSSDTFLYSTTGKMCHFCTRVPVWHSVLWPVVDFTVVPYTYIMESSDERDCCSRNMICSTSLLLLHWLHAIQMCEDTVTLWQRRCTLERWSCATVEHAQRWSWTQWQACLHTRLRSARWLQPQLLRTQWKTHSTHHNLHKVPWKHTA